MREFVVRLMLSCICLQLSIGPAAFAGQLSLPPSYETNLDLPMNDRPPVRKDVKTCRVAFATGDQKDEGVGLPFLKGNSPEAFESQLKKTIAERGLSWFAGGTFYVTGIDMRNAEGTRQVYQTILNRNGLSAKQVRILDVPSRLLGDLSVGVAEHLIQRARYFPPSIKRDYQPPKREEVIENLKAMAVVESFGVVYVLKTMPWEQALILKTISLSVLIGYNIYQKSMINWLDRSGSDNKVDQFSEGFGRQWTLSLPFTTNYQIVGNLNKITDYYYTHGLQAMSQVFPEHALQFATSTFGLLTIQQTIFYSTVIVGKFGKWMNSQVGDDNVNDAKVLRPWLQVPILAADIVFLLMATNSDATPLFNAGPLSVTAGHIGLAALTAGSLLAFKVWPNMLDPALNMFQSFKRARALRREAKAAPSTRDSNESEKQDP